MRVCGAALRAVWGGELSERAARKREECAGSLSDSEDGGRAESMDAMHGETGGWLMAG